MERKVQGLEVSGAADSSSSFPVKSVRQTTSDSRKRLRVLWTNGCMRERLEVSKASGEHANACHSSPEFLIRAAHESAAAASDQPAHNGCRVSQGVLLPV